MTAAFFLDASGADAKIKELKKNIEVDLQSVLEEALTDARDEIIARTEKGESADGLGFPDYSDGYKAAKARRLGSASPVNLSLGVKHLSLKRRKNKPGKGSKYPPGMLRSMQVKVAKLGRNLVGTIFFPASQQAKARGNQALRNFFSLSNSQLEKIKKRISEAINGRR